MRSYSYPAAMVAFCALGMLAIWIVACVNNSFADANVDVCCADLYPPTSVRVQPQEIVEASGLAVSVRTPGVLWIHNDSGDSARVFALDLATGALRGTLSYTATLPTPVVDVEDMAAGDGFLFLGDIGDNGWTRPYVVVYRMIEPEAPTAIMAATEPEAPTAIMTATAEAMRLTYPDGPRDAETLLYDAPTRELYIAEKTLGATQVYRAGPFAPGATVRMMRAARISISAAPVGAATAGDITRDGSRIAIRNSSRAWIWTRSPGQSVGSALGGKPCEIPLPAESQGEAFGWLPAGNGYVTVAEGVGESIHTTLFAPPPL